MNGNTNIILGKRIKERREALGMTQEELAFMIGYKSRASINKIELGERELRQKKIKEISDALKVSPAELMGWVELDPAPQLQPNEKKLLDSFRELSAEGQERLIDEADMMVASGRYKKTSSELTGTEGV